MHRVDLAVLIVYLVGITALGVWIGRGVKGVQEFFMPRRFGAAMMIANAFGTGTASDQAVVVAAATFRQGLSGIWWQWIWLPATPFYWVIAPIMRRFRAVTTADVYALRFDKSVSLLFAVVGILGLAVKIGLMLKGAGALFESCSGGLVHAKVAIPVITLLFVIYGTAGGLSAAIVTDFIQGLLTIVFSFLLLPFVLNAVGGLAGMRSSIVNPQMLQLVVPGQIGVFFVVMFSLQALLGIVAQPFIMGVCGAGRTELDGRIGFMVGNIAKRICTMAWSVTALAAVAWYMEQGTDLATVNPDHVYGDVALAFLPNVLPGLLGLFLASLLASVMSSCDAFMISSSALFTQNIYRAIRPTANETHHLAVGRVAALVTVLAGLAFAYWVPNVQTALSVWFKIAPMIGIAFWMGLFWRRVTAAAAWAITLTGFSVWWMTGQPWFVHWLGKLPLAERWSMIWTTAGKAPEVNEPWVILFYTAAAVLVGIVVSLCTRPVATEQLDRFYTLTRTPIGHQEVLVEPCRLPVGVEPAPRRMLCTAFDLEIPIPSRLSCLGFLGGWIAVAVLVLGFAGLMS